MLTELDRGEDYIELSLDGRLTWNPLSETLQWFDGGARAADVQVERAVPLRIDVDDLEGRVVRPLPELAVHPFDIVLPAIRHLVDAATTADPRYTPSTTRREAHTRDTQARYAR